MAPQPPQPQILYIPPTPPPAPAPPVQQPQGTPGQFANRAPGAGAPSFMSSAGLAPAPTQTGQRTLLGT